MTRLALVALVLVSASTKVLAQTAAPTEPPTLPTCPSGASQVECPSKGYGDCISNKDDVTCKWCGTSNKICVPGNTRDACDDWKTYYSNCRPTGVYENTHTKRKCSYKMEQFTDTTLEECKVKCDENLDCVRVFYRESDSTCNINNKNQCSGGGYSGGNFDVYKRIADSALPTKAPTPAPTNAPTEPTAAPTLPVCPTGEEQVVCPTFAYIDCINGGTESLNCNWCGSSNKICVPGGNGAACSDWKDFYDHCRPKGVYEKTHSKRKCSYRMEQLADTTLEECQVKCDENLECVRIFYRESDTTCNINNKNQCSGGGFTGGNYDVYKRIEDSTIPTLSPTQAPSATPTTSPTDAPSATPTTGRPTVDPEKCPPYIDIEECSTYKSKAHCTVWKTKGKDRCTWCSGIDKCRAGLDAQVCAVDGYYDHCTAAPTAAPTITPGTYEKISSNRVCKPDIASTYLNARLTRKDSNELCAAECDKKFKCAGYAYNRNSNFRYCRLFEAGKCDSTQSNANFDIYNRTSAANPTSAPTDAPTTAAPTIPPTKIGCPPQGAFNLCPAVGNINKKTQCNNKKNFAGVKICTWCYNKDVKGCMPGRDSAICSDPDLYTTGREGEGLAACTEAPTTAPTTGAPTNSPTKTPTTGAPTRPRPPGIYTEIHKNYLWYRCKTGIATLDGTGRYETKEECGVKCDDDHTCFGYNFKALKDTANNNDNCKLYAADCTRTTTSVTGWNFYQRTGETTYAPTDAPTKPTAAPTDPPTDAPTNSPTAPTTGTPTDTPTTGTPTKDETPAPTTGAPTTGAPTDGSGTDTPATDSPTTATKSPTDPKTPPTKKPTRKPATRKPTKRPTEKAKKKVQGKLKMKNLDKLSDAQLKDFETTVKGQFSPLCGGCAITVKKDGDNLVYEFEIENAQTVADGIKSSETVIKSGVNAAIEQNAALKDLGLEVEQVEDAKVCDGDCDDDDDSSGAGLVIGIIAGVVVLGGGGFFLYQKQNKGASYSSQGGHADNDLVVKDPVKKRPVLETELSGI